MIGMQGCPVCQKLLALRVETGRDDLQWEDLGMDSTEEHNKAGV